MKCPKCNFVQCDGGTECKKCKVIFEKVGTATGNFSFTIEEAPRTNPLRYIVGIALVFLLGVTGFHQLREEEVSSDETVQAANEPLLLDSSARSAYERAKRAVARCHYERAVEYFDLAISSQPDFLEAYYNRAAAKTFVAIERMKDEDEAGSLQMFREAVADKERAQELMDEGRWYVYTTKHDQNIVRTDVKEALKDSDEVMQNEAALKVALKLYADRMGN